MLNVCYQCGSYRADKGIDPTGPSAICPECGYKHPFVQMPLLIVSGASGTGKSTVCHRLTGRLNQVVLLDSDILWRPEFNSPTDNYREFFETWLRLCKNIAQSGRPVVLFGAGFGVPDNIEPRIERRYFSTISYLALVCSDEALATRLQHRPAWRENGPAFIQEQIRFNGWFMTRDGNRQPAVQLLDTTSVPIQETARQVESWINTIWHDQ